ncbi:Peptide transporter PTR2 [Hordeum vulgare]|nr:Peptide transporter PTR2 [Hordeum vulgare]
MQQNGRQPGDGGVDGLAGLGLGAPSPPLRLVMGGSRGGGLAAWCGGAPARAGSSSGLEGRAPFSESRPKIQEDDSLQVPLLKHKKHGGSSKAPAVILLFECLESTAFNGISTNLVVYLETVLHGTNLASASNVATWFGTSYLTPLFGAIIADTFWGNYNTILVSLAVYLLGMMLVTFSAFVPRPRRRCARRVPRAPPPARGR